jgi:hypothetical protein
MNKAHKANVADLHPNEAVSPPLRDVASYLRGVADATAALSQPPTSASVQHRLSHAGQSSSPISLRRTIPYGGYEGGADSTHSGQDVEHRSLEAIADEGLSTHESPNEPFVDERPSHVRLRIGTLSPEWFELLGVRAG